MSPERDHGPGLPGDGGQELSSEPIGDATAWRRAYADGLTAGSPDCPSEEALAALVLGEAPARAVAARRPRRRLRALR